MPRLQVEAFPAVLVLVTGGPKGLGRREKKKKKKKKKKKDLTLTGLLMEGVVRLETTKRWFRRP
jgi:hypothetical protein